MSTKYFIGCSKKAQTFLKCMVILLFVVDLKVVVSNSRCQKNKYLFTGLRTHMEMEEGLVINVELLLVKMWNLQT